MSMLEVHSKALEGTSEVYHVFLQRYSKSSRHVYGIVEGFDDASFYRPLVETLLPDDWEIRLINAKNKDNVYALHDEIDWRRFRKKRVCFFVDRDLSDLIPEHRPRDQNIYVSRWYSIENELATEYAMRRLLSELAGFDAASQEDIRGLAGRFTVQVAAFYNHLIEVMAWILVARRTRQPANLDNVEMRRIFEIKAGQVHVRHKPAGYNSIVEYLEAQLGMPKPSSSDLQAAIDLFNQGENRKAFARGKYVLWFVFEYCNSVKSAAGTLCKSISKARSGFPNLSAKNGLPAAASRARIPPCLRKFVHENFLAHVNR